MLLSKEQVEHIAKLARLSLTDDEIVRFQEQLSSILAYFQQLKELDTSDISPSARALDIPCTLREDKPAQGLTVDELMIYSYNFHNSIIRPDPRAIMKP